MGTHSQIGSHRIRSDTEHFTRHGYLAVPNLVQWMATLRCELSCEHCLAVSRESGFSDMPLEKVKALIDEIAAMGVREFLLTGGEPLVRDDLGEVLEYLGRRKVNWTLNTAALPNATLRKAIARHCPGFVAVSLDGPSQVHDAFRGKPGAWDDAMEAIRFFKSLPGVTVCAGTTVTTRNYDHLDETFYLVAGSGADRWGIHLLVPEGRARQRKDLFLSRTQLKRLIRFVARRRQYFSVEMADEIGYLGYLEPLVRTAPLLCGAGRSQCVVLPDGEVVPCTTLDRSTSAGNLHERSLAEIWATGFEALRTWRPTGKCVACDYAVACKGGCWLQRKAGTHCFQDVWHVPDALKTAAGIAICLGALATPTTPSAEAASPAATSMDHTLQASVSPERRRGPDDTTEEEFVALDDAIMAFYISQVTSYVRDDQLHVDPNDPAGQFFIALRNGTLPQDVTERCLLVSNALQTGQRSLSLIALLWRAINGPFFEIDDVTPYSEAERQMIRDTLGLLRDTAEAWRLEIFENTLDLYLANGRQTTPICSNSKAGGPWPCVDPTTYLLLKDLNEERWGKPNTPDSREAAEAYLLDHHYADQMDLVFAVTAQRGGTLLRYSAMDVEVIDPALDPGPHIMGVFDTIAVQGDIMLHFEIKGNLRVEASPYDDNEDALLDDQAAEEELSKLLQIHLIPGREYTYTELLHFISWRQRSLLGQMADDWLQGQIVNLWGRDQINIVTGVHQNGALLWPAFREIVETGMVPGHDQDGHPIDVPLSDRNLRRALLKEIDFWMF